MWKKNLAESDCTAEAVAEAGANSSLSHSSEQIRSLTASIRVTGTLATHQCPVASCLHHINEFLPTAKTHFHREKPSVLLLISY